MLGPETFCESFNGARHNYYPRFDTILYIVKFALALITLFTLSTAFIIDFQKKNVAPIRLPALAFMVLVLFTYTFLILITESFFDRYHLPLISISSILIIWLFKEHNAELRLAFIPVAFYACISIFGTKDYFEWNTQRWSANRYLRNELNIPLDKINGGFEVNCWHEGVDSGWYGFLDAGDFDYLIQFNNVKGFTKIKEFEFQRYLPYKKDKIFIFARQDSLTLQNH